MLVRHGIAEPTVTVTVTVTVTNSVACIGCEWRRTETLASWTFSGLVSVTSIAFQVWILRKEIEQPISTLLPPRGLVSLLRMSSGRDDHDWVKEGVGLVVHFSLEDVAKINTP